MRFFVVFNQFFNIMKRFSIFCLPAVVMAGALLLASCGKDNSTPTPAPAPYDPSDLSAKGAANCYIVSAPGTYHFKTVKGNSNEAVSAVTAELLWESVGTLEAPEKNSIISSVSYADNIVTFTTPATLKNGNAVIAVRDGSEKISWSWHIWVCEGYDPAAKAQVYKNDAGTMMDRNLGATSAEPGKVETIGLMYQWGRKDPFLGCGRLSYNTKAVSTPATWPAPVASDATNGSVEYAIENPTTFITANDNNDDWLFTGPNNDLWKAEKSIYDPCPVGWKVPAGGATGIWATALEVATSSTGHAFSDGGMNFSGEFGDDERIWYPFTGNLLRLSGEVVNAESSSYWSSQPSIKYARVLTIRTQNGFVHPADDYTRGAAHAVRCCKE